MGGNQDNRFEESTIRRIYRRIVPLFLAALIDAAMPVAAKPRRNAAVLGFMQRES